MQRTYLISGVNVVVLALLALGIYRAAERAALPATASDVKAVNGIALESRHEAEFYVTHFRIGDTVSITDPNAAEDRVVLVPFYTWQYTLVQSFVVLVYALLGMFILRKKKGDLLSRSFYILTLTLAALVAHTTGSFSTPTTEISLALEILFHLAYAYSGVLFLYFIFTFGKYQIPRALTIALLTVSLILAGVTSYFFTKTHNDLITLQSFADYDLWLKLTRIWFALLFISGIGVLIHAISTRQQPSLNKQLRWVLYGCTISILAYILLWQIPILLGKPDIIAEETMLLLAVIAPIAIAIGIVRHHLFDIDLLIRKSISYTLLVAVTIGVYMTVITGATWLVHQFNGTDTIFPAAAAAIVAALLFDPLRRKVSHFVDKKFFRTSYDFRRAQRQFLDDSMQALDIRTLGWLVVERIQQIIPVARIGFFVLNEDVRRMRLIAHEGFAILERHSVSFTPEDLKTELAHPVALPEFVEEATIEVADRPTFERWKIALVIPMLREAKKPIGFIVLGKRRSDTRFSADDVELLTNVASQTSIALERLLLQQKLLIEQAESQRLDELNRLKSFFVSSVTHDLKTPLTSIRLYAELLQSPLAEEKKIAYLRTIEAETDRLARLITNVLDFARIEQGSKAYALRPVDLSVIVNDAVDLLRHQIEADGFTLEASIVDSPVTICADRDAITGVIINLLSNAMKYSGPERKHIAVTLQHKEKYASLEIADRGIGIVPEAVKHIFEPFYRVTQSTGSGAGLGLAIVKHTLDAHKAEAVVTSTPGVGTTFTITIPLI